MPRSACSLFHVYGCKKTTTIQEKNRSQISVSTWLVRTLWGNYRCLLPLPLDVYAGRVGRADYTFATCRHEAGCCVKKKEQVQSSGAIFAENSTVEQKKATGESVKDGIMLRWHTEHAKSLITRSISSLEQWKRTIGTV